MSEGITSASDNARAGMELTAKRFDLISRNVAGINDPDLPRRVADIKASADGTVTYGASLAAIRLKIDYEVLAKLQEQHSDFEAAKISEAYQKRVEDLFGKPNSDSTISAQVSDFFASLERFTIRPESSTARSLVIQKANGLMSRLSNTAKGLYDLRYEVDHEIKKTVDTLNEKLGILENINRSIITTPDINTNQGADLLASRNKVAKEIAGLIDVQGLSTPEGIASLMTKSGKTLIDVNRLKLDYMPVGSVQALITNLPLSAVSGYYVDASGTVVSDSENIISGGAEGEIATILGSGKLHALQQFRDGDLVESLKQIDQLAETVRNKINAIHNDGVAHAPVSQLKGTLETTLGSERDFEGSVRIALLDKSGLPVTRNDGSPLNPLTLDLAKLNGGNGAGKVTTQAILNEINEYYFLSPSIDRTTLGGLYDIKMAAMSQTIAPNGSFSFDFELDHGAENSVKPATFEVLNVSVFNSANTPVPGALTSALPSAFTILPGSRMRSGGKIDLNFSTGGAGPFTVRTQVRVTDGNGISHLSELDFVVDDTPSNTTILNKRYAASVFSGAATKVKAQTTQPFLQAQLLNSAGNDATSVQSGKLHLTAIESDPSNPRYRIAIDEMDSKDLGLNASSATGSPATNRGFSHYFGLNNFIEDSYQTRASAYHLKIRQDILSDHAKFSVASLEPSSPEDRLLIVGEEKAKGSLTFSANPTVNDTITIKGTTFTFVAAAAADNQITIAPSLSQTLDNIIAKLNASNNTTSGTVDQASYTIQGSDTITMTHKSSGSLGNSFTVSFNFLGAVKGSINGGTMSSSQSDHFSGGTDTEEYSSVTPFTYEVSSGNVDIAHQMAELSTAALIFGATGHLPEMTKTFGDYVAEMTEFQAKRTFMSMQETKTVEIVYRGIEDKYKENSGINIQNELLEGAFLSRLYEAYSIIMQTTSKLFDSLLAAARTGA